MKNNNLTPDAELVYSLICSVGAVTTPQLEKILKNSKGNAGAIVHFLCRQRYTKWLNELYSMPFYCSELNKNAIYCLWVMIDLITDKDGSVNIGKLEKIIEGNGIVEFSYIQNDNIVVNMVYLNSTDVAKIAASKQRFYSYSGAAKGEEKSAGVVYMYVTSSPDMVAKLKDSNIEFPYKIAYLEGDIDRDPAISYL